MPTSVDMTDEVMGRLSDRGQMAVLEFVRHTIAADLAQREVTSSGGFGAVEVVVEVDVERLFATVDLLANRLDQPLAPFVGSWHPGLEGFAAYGHDSSFHARTTLERALGQIADHRGTHTVAQGIERFVNAAIARSRGGDVSELLARTRDSMLRSLFDILNIENAERVRYLTPLVELSRQQHSLSVATLNYDRSVENVAALHGEECHTGIDNWVDRGSLEWPTQGLSLMKLHGSVDWVFESSGHEKGKLPRQAIRTVSGLQEKARYDSPAVVFGEAGKLRAEGPFLELLLSWSDRIQTADALVVAGYSFRDPHVNEVIARWFNNSDYRRIVVVDPNLNPGTRDSFLWQLATVDQRFPKPETPAAPRYVHIPASTATGLAQAIGVAADVRIDSGSAASA
jgi:hypothetical protein